MAKKPAGLGKGFDNIFFDNSIEEKSGITRLRIGQIEPKADQPRRVFEGEALAELADSIAVHGVLQPILVREIADGHYQIIAGERRYRASKMAGLTEVPVIVLDKSDLETAQISLIENIQREDLNPIEIALAYQGLIEQYGLKQEELSAKVGKKRATVTNYLRLLKLPAQVQMALKNKEIDQGHARALLGLPSAATQLKVFEEIKNQGLSVRKVEEMVNRLNSGEDVNNSGKRIRARRDKDNSDEYNALQKHLSDHFGTKVKMTCSPEGKGKITIPFRNQEEMERIIAMLDKGK